MSWKVFALLFGALSILAPRPSNAASAWDKPDCFDAEVNAGIAQQTPTAVLGCGSNCIVMSWPWILKLHVERVIKGTLPSKATPLTVLTVQHAYYRTDLPPRRWWLRRNSLGVFNVIKIENGPPLPLCPGGSKPAKPYISLPTGKTLADVEREAEHP